MGSMGVNRAFCAAGFIVFALILFLYLSYPNDRVEFSQFNSNDSSEYITLSQSLYEKGEYTRNVDGDYVPHKTWPPGMPILLLPSVISGETVNQLVGKYTIIILSLASLLLIWLISYQFTHSLWLGGFVSTTIAMNPVYWELSRVLLPSIPVTFWCLASFYIILKTYKSAVNIKYYFWIGLLTGLGVLIKGTLIVLAALPAAYFIYRYVFLNQKFFSNLHYNLKTYAVFLFGFLFTFVLWTIRNSQIPSEGLGFDGINQVVMIMAKEPADPSLGYLSALDIINNVRNNIIWHLIYILPENVIPFFNFIELRDLRFGNYIAVFSSILIFVVSLLKWRITGLFYAIILPMIAILIPMSTGGSERYWVVISVFLAMAFYISLFLTIQDKVTYINKYLWIKLSCLSYFIIQVYLLMNYALAFEKQPNNTKHDYPEFVKLVTYLQSYCQDNEAIVSIDKNAAAISAYTQCKAPKTNLQLKIEPLYSYVILEKKYCAQSCKSIGESTYTNEGWVLLRLPKHLNKTQIDSLIRGTNKVLSNLNE